MDAINYLKKRKVMCEESIDVKYDEINCEKCPFWSHLTNTDYGCEWLEHELPEKAVRIVTEWHLKKCCSN